MARAFVGNPLPHLQEDLSQDLLHRAIPQPQRVSVALTHFLFLTQMDHSAMFPLSTRPLWRESITPVDKTVRGPQRQQRLLVSKDNKHTVMASYFEFIFK